MTWLAVLGQFVSLPGDDAEEAEARAAEARANGKTEEARTSGRAQAISETLSDAIALITKANLARRGFRSDLHADPGSLLADDGYRRDDGAAGSNDAG